MQTLKHTHTHKKDAHNMSHFRKGSIHIHKAMHQYKIPRIHCLLYYVVVMEYLLEVMCQNIPVVAKDLSFANDQNKANGLPPTNTLGLANEFSLHIENDMPESFNNQLLDATPFYDKHMVIPQDPKHVFADTEMPSKRDFPNLAVLSEYAASSLGSPLRNNSSGSCTKGQFRCQNGQCVALAHRCDNWR